MNLRLGAVVLVLFASACSKSDGPPAPLETARSALGKIPASEVGTWTRVGGDAAPEPRMGQALAFDSKRGVTLMFFGDVAAPGKSRVLRQEIWEWNATKSGWHDRTPTGAAPDARSDAAVAYDSANDRFIMFGGRSASGLNYEDTWEWDPATGTWADKTGAGAKPDGRARHAMVFDPERKVVVLFGGGVSAQSADLESLPGIAGISVALASTWEYDPATGKWVDRSPTDTAASPAARYDAGLVWDSSDKVAVLFGGMQKSQATEDGQPLQDVWTWDGVTGTWTERTVSGQKPSPRFGHGMAFDAGTNRDRVMVFGGYDIDTGKPKNDLWEWNPASGLWTERVPALGATVPTPSIWASMAYDSSTHRMELIAGYLGPENASSGHPFAESVWELEPVAGTWTEPPNVPDGPGPRNSYSMATDLASGKVYLFGGCNESYQAYNDLWSWDGKVWTASKTSSTPPPPRFDGSLAYDPSRKSLILFGGQERTPTFSRNGTFGDTWAWDIEQATWTPIKLSTNPAPRHGGVMVTDTNRNRIILAAGQDDYGRLLPKLADVWEWDGTTQTWTDCSPPAGAPTPDVQIPRAGFDAPRGKVVVWNDAAVWEWDPVARAWSTFDVDRRLGVASGAAFDSARRRLVAVAVDRISDPQELSGHTLELDAANREWYSRPSPKVLQPRGWSSMAYDNRRGVAVLYGGTGYTGGPHSDTWEYRVTGSANGTPCSSDLTSQCASGFCVDGVCCESAACSGPCQSCSVAGQAGTCVLAAAGTQVAGSCSGQTACDGQGSCKAANGTLCAAETDCASGHCADGVCCNSDCSGTCLSCRQPGLEGKCSPYRAGTDPEKECGQGAVPCQSVCDGVGACAFPNNDATCGPCEQCDGHGSCLPAPSHTCTYPDAGMAEDDAGPEAGDSDGSGGRAGAGGWGGFGGAGSGGTGGSSTGTGGTAGVLGPDGGTGIDGQSGSGGVGAAGAGGTSALGYDAGESSTAGSRGAFDAALMPDGAVARDGSGFDAKIDGNAPDASGSVKLKRGGCSCALGSTASPSLGACAAVLLLGLTWLRGRAKQRHADAGRSQHLDVLPTAISKGRRRESHSDAGRKEIQWGNVKEGPTIAISTPRARYKVAEPIRLQIWLKNAGATATSVVVRSPWIDYSLSIYDDKGIEVVMTAHGVTAREAAAGSRRATRELSPGEVLIDELDLERGYELRLPGTYKVVAKRQRGDIPFACFASGMAQYATVRASEPVLKNLDRNRSLHTFPICINGHPVSISPPSRSLSR